MYTKATLVACYDWAISFVSITSGFSLKSSNNLFMDIGNIPVETNKSQYNLKVFFKQKIEDRFLLKLIRFSASKNFIFLNTYVFF